MIGFEKKGQVSLWAFLKEPAEDVDLMRELCGVDYYDLDDQEGNFSEDGKLTPLRQLISPLSYANSFIDEAERAAKDLRITESIGVMAQYDFAYDPTKITRQMAPDPIFLGSFPWHE
ncbi:MAG TPA: hypothetical protein VN688_22225 [Gemmataceae bacterium]|nr:hypothetical protein [Gemmataceae bacterium]